VVTPIAATVTTELLEREAPLRVLAAALDEAARGCGSAVLVSGEPGIGKSALVTSFATDRAATSRVLFGICDDLAIPRPLGPFRDLTDDLPAPVTDALRDGRAPGEFATLLVRELRGGSAPTVLVIEDVHWADQATTDALTIVARRLPELPVLLVLTLRPGELTADHPLRTAIDAMQRSPMLHLELPPLTRAAVARLAGDEAERVHELSAGNPFFVTELLAHGTEPFPPSLANAVLGRVARLEPETRQWLELLSVVPGRVPVPLLDRLEAGWATAVAEAERRQLVTSDRRYVRFRHELTRAAIRSSLPHGRRRLLHRRVLDVLLELGTDPADIVHHAEAAGADEVVAEHALDAATRALAIGSNREAYAHLRRARELAVDRLSAADRLALFEQYARSAWLTGHLGEALAAVTRAGELADELGDAVAHGRSLRRRAHLHWFRGDGQAAWRDACAGVRRLEGAGPPVELALSYAQAAELSMLAGRTEETVRFGQRALRLGADDGAVQAQALGAIGALRLQLDIDDPDAALEALEVALEGELHNQVVFSLVALAFVHVLWVQPGAARLHAEQSRSYARAHEFDGMVAFIDALLAWLELRDGRRDRATALVAERVGTRPLAAGTIAEGTIAEGTIAEHQAELVLTELAVRRGDPDADQRLADLVALADRTGEPSRIAPVLELEVERALTTGTALPVDRVEAIASIVGPQALGAGCAAARIAAWATVCGVPVRFAGKAPAPHAAMIARHWREAADAFGGVGWTHDRALLLSLCEDEEALVEALDIARSRSAAPLEERVCRRLRALGYRVPRGPLAATQANPAQLTPRQLEVLQLVRDGHRNARIAELLHISPRTVEHHVAGIFDKLGVSSRAEAMARVADLGFS
jgi:DNA-binding CsgD family transcriptional regulator/tetratricopeptide (TPR) repeat protein